MGTYANQSTVLNPQKRLTGRDTDVVGEERAKMQQRNADYFATINQSTTADAAKWPYELKTFARPKGRATRVIITEWDLPRPTIQPHDVVVDSKGIVWYSDFGSQFIGKFDPKTGKLTEIPTPELKKGSPLGALSIRMDRDENLWLGMMYQAAIGKFDTKTGKLQVWPIPAEWNRPNTQVNMTSPLNIAVDGKVWTQNNGFAGVHRVDLKTGEWETWEPFKAAPVGHNIYDVISDSKNNAWFTDIGRETIGRIDAKTKEVTLYETPTKSSGPRRGIMDAQDRIWFGQYRGNRIGMFDTKTERFQEWEVPTPWSGPVRRRARQERRGVDRLDAERPHRAAQPEDRAVRRIPAAADHQRPPGVRGQLDDTRSRSGSAATTAPPSSSSSRSTDREGGDRMNMCDRTADRARAARGRAAGSHHAPGGERLGAGAQAGRLLRRALPLGAGRVLRQRHRRPLRAHVRARRRSSIAEYRIEVRTVVEQLGLWPQNGAFELKEHFAAVGLAILPAYWHYWRAAAAGEHARTRAILTLLLAFIVWWNFLVGHILNNIRGFGS